MNSEENSLLTVPLKLKAFQLGRQFAAEQMTAHKGKQVYLNTLAVYAVHNCLQWLHVKTDLSQSQAWNPALRAVLNVADLFIPGLGRLECCPLLPGQTAFELAPEVAGERIGYLAVQFSESLYGVQLLGFAKAVDISEDAEEILITEFQSMDTFLEYLPTNIEPKVIMSEQVNLSYWLQNIFDSNWQTVEELFKTEMISASNVRNTNLLIESDERHPVLGVKRGKVIDLGVQILGCSVALLVNVALAATDKVNVILQVYPAARSKIYLPPNLQLIVIDEFGSTCLEVEARNADNLIQLEFSGRTGECFSVKLALGDASITEQFIL